MNIDRLWHLVKQLKSEYFCLIDEVSSCFLQEMINPETFNDDIPPYSFTPLVISDIRYT